MSQEPLKLNTHILSLFLFFSYIFIRPCYYITYHIKRIQEYNIYPYRDVCRQDKMPSFLLFRTYNNDERTDTPVNVSYKINGKNVFQLISQDRSVFVIFPILCHFLMNCYCVVFFLSFTFLFLTEKLNMCINYSLVGQFRHIVVHISCLFVYNRLIQRQDSCFYNTEINTSLLEIKQISMLPKKSLSFQLRFIFGLFPNSKNANSIMTTSSQHDLHVHLLQLAAVLMMCCFPHGTSPSKPQGH